MFEKIQYVDISMLFFKFQDSKISLRFIQTFSHYLNYEAVIHYYDLSVNAIIKAQNTIQSKTQLKSAKIVQKIKITSPKQLEENQNLETKLKQLQKEETESLIRFNLSQFLIPKKKVGGLFRCYKNQNENFFNYPLPQEIVRKTKHLIIY
ncbi:unnamed protein product (macronuclear) [Paramecium tetraurelia]|uniref:Uncharacterized protein n=1 Tax=Paramecium tetraurelia TaxID=5888 RepID=A0BJV8_PARTE|nr:uncharacterized protein GSPATT00029455001 [Paramecium tetraurelia]CAK58825.1 unnamed protein product [Paramecium tetraurelia]|eukprot:XP_001426223.1 hypothetical protein (macronuclear) [Paramecium tetraurelia strain d4-2]